MTMIPASAEFEQRDDWKTPSWILHAVRQSIPYLNWDLAASEQNTCCERFFDEESDFLTADLSEIGADIAWMNPPFSLALRFFARAFQEHLRFVAIYKANNLETAAWQVILKNCDYIGLFKRRVNYVHPDTGHVMTGVPFPSALVFNGIDDYRVKDLAKRLGLILLKPEPVFSDFEVEML